MDLDPRGRVSARRWSGGGTYTYRDVVMTTVYIRLLDEGTEVFRPTLAESLGRGKFKVLPTPNYDPEDEIWEFTPGSIVVCAKQKLEGEEVLVAMKAHDAPPK